jgi:hypothetical protein
MLVAIQALSTPGFLDIISGQAYLFRQVHTLPFIKRREVTLSPVLTTIAIFAILSFDASLFFSIPHKVIRCKIRLLGTGTPKPAVFHEKSSTAEPKIAVVYQKFEFFVFFILFKILAAARIGIGQTSFIAQKFSVAEFDITDRPCV